MSDLVKRLRKDVFYGDERMHNFDRHNPLHMDAADRIEALEAENARLKLALGQIQRRESPDAGKPYERVLCSCGMHGPCMADDCKDPIVLRSAKYMGEVDDNPNAGRFDEYGHYGESNPPVGERTCK